MSVLVLRSVCAPLGFCVGCVPVLVLQVCVFVESKGNVPVLGSKGCALESGSEEPALVCPLWVVRGVRAQVASQDCVPD